MVLGQETKIIGYSYHYYEVTVENTDNTIKEWTNSCIAMGIDRRRSGSIRWLQEVSYATQLLRM